MPTDRKVLAMRKFQSWRADPVLWAKEDLGIDLDAWQLKVARDYMTNPRLAMKACKGPGKSFMMAVLGWHYLMSHRHSIGCAVSITGDNLRDGLWTELKRLQMRSRLLSGMFTWTKTRIYANEAPETWWISARTFDKSASAESQSNTLAGLHNENYDNAIIILLDEAGDMPPGLVAAADAIMANAGKAMILMAGNPTSISGALYEVCTRHREHWAVTEITSDPEDPDRTPRVSLEWAQNTIDMWGGRENPYVMVNILGQFPSKGFNQLFSLCDVERVLGKHIDQMLYSSQVKILGIDVAGEGDDKTVLFPRQGLAAFNPVIMRGATPEQVAERVNIAYNNFKPDVINIDNTGGWATGVRVILRQMGIHVNPIGFAEQAEDKAQFFNRRAEMYYRAAQYIKDGGVLPNCGDMVSELTELTYSFRNDRILLEPKELLKEKIGRSPDVSDAFALTFALEVPASQARFKNGAKTVKAKSNWKHWAERPSHAV